MECTFNKSRSIKVIKNKNYCIWKRDKMIGKFFSIMTFFFFFFSFFFFFFFFFINFRDRYDRKLMTILKDKSYTVCHENNLFECFVTGSTGSTVEGISRYFHPSQLSDVTDFLWKQRYIWMSWWFSIWLPIR